jgi:hypothetical protein
MARSTVNGLPLLRAALLGATALMLMGPTGAAARVGVTSATDGDPRGRPPAEAERILRIGIDVQANEVITTSSNDRAHLVFLDGTSLTVGPNALLTIDKFVFDPASKTGELSVNAARGVFRVVGGKISKSNAITIVTPSSTIGIRGGITIVNVQPTRTESTFVFGTSMVVSGGGGTQNVTRPGSQVTTNTGSTPNPPALISQGALGAQMSQLEGKSAGTTTGGGGTTTGGGSGPAINSVTVGADPNAQTFSQQNSGQGTGVAQVPSVTATNAPNPINPATINTTNAISNTNQQQQTDQAPAPAPPPPPATTTQVIVTRGRYLADPTYTNFNPATLGVTPVATNNMALAPAGTLTTTTATNVTRLALSLSDGRAINLPWQTNTLANGFAIGTFTDPTFGTITGRGYISSGGDFFAYVFADSSNNPLGFIGGTPTASFPTSGIAAYDIRNGAAGTLPFADTTVGGNANLQAAASISKLLTAFSTNTSSSSSSPVRSTALQATVSIFGLGASQQSYMGVVTGDFFKDSSNNSTFVSGGYTGSYRLAAGQPIGRLTGAVSTPSTGAGYAVYGQNANQIVFTPDQLSASAVLTPQAAFNQPYTNLTGTSYTTVSVANLSTTPSVGARTTQTLNGFAGGVAEQRTSGGTITSRNFAATDAANVSLSTDATANRAAAAITVQNWNTGTSATFQLGGTTGTSAGNSAFIDDSRYAMQDRTAALGNSTSVTTSGGTSTGAAVTSQTTLVSYSSAPTANLFTASNVSPCVCEFLTMGYWGGDVSYANNSVYNPGGRDRLNLATYVAGTLTPFVQLPNTGTATFAGHAIGNVVNNGNSYTAVGQVLSSFNFASQTGSFGINNFDGANKSYNGSIALRGGTVQFNGSLVGTGGATGRTGTVNGAFFSAPGNPVAGQGGAFTIAGPAYTAGGTFATKKVSP